MSESEWASVPTDRVTVEWMTGCLLSLTASFFGSLGDNCVKLSYNRSGAAAPGTSLPATSRRLFFFGWFCSIAVNCTLNLWALSMAPLALVIPFAGTHMLFNLLLATKLNKEVLRQRDLGAALLIFAGTTIVLVFGPKSDTRHSLEKLGDQLSGVGIPPPTPPPPLHTHTHLIFDPRRRWSPPR
jgi:drug/metabolite transporter (DMT)-like permease